MQQFNPKRRAFLAGFLFVIPLSAAKHYRDQGRGLHGSVTDRNGALLTGAFVQLKNMLTLSIRSYIVQEDGMYHFWGLSPDIDYEVEAHFGMATSEIKRLSVFNTSSLVQIDLEVRTTLPPSTSASAL